MVFIPIFKKYWDKGFHTILFHKDRMDGAQNRLKKIYSVTASDNKAFSFNQKLGKFSNEI